MNLTESWCTFIITAASLLLAVLGFSKEIRGKSEKLKFIDNILVKLGITFFCIFAGAFADQRKDQIAQIDVVKRDSTINNLQQQTINEIKGANLPFLAGYVTESDGYSGFVISIFNHNEKVPAFNVEVSYRDPLNHNKPIDTIYNVLFEKDQRIIYQKSSKNIPDGSYLFYVQIGWRSGTYSYQITLNKKDDKLSTTNPGYYFKQRFYKADAFGKLAFK
jgi:hypothetical protein